MENEMENIKNPLDDLEKINPCLIQEMAETTVDPEAAAREEEEWQRQYNQPRESEPESPETDQETPDPENPEPETDQGQDQDNDYTPGLRPGL